ncbi:MAG TPA: hypothetical protein H9831_10490 [Candidatus Eisenbergiella pullistercoris]|uniref:Uncharacterized protein n=1 Tax=Candidatus Eisenbergiella pullistercoris TaxID=2838555 RepID=A0A9D1YRT7_9FIRM|nr:hypothetical protein [Candidatus Eisenbergiella pullistercoris]
MRDLKEAFDSALEHGETQQQVIRRLGTPKEFADSAAAVIAVLLVIRAIRTGRRKS